MFFEIATFRKTLRGRELETLFLTWFLLYADLHVLYIQVKEIYLLR